MENKEPENKYEIHEVYLCEMCLEAWDEDDLKLKDGKWICQDCLKPCKHLHDDGSDALRAVGREEDHMEVCDICSKVVSSNPPEETDRDLV